MKIKKEGFLNCFSKIVILLIIVLGGFFVCKSAMATDIIWDNSEVRVINGIFVINGWEQLIIEPGTIIKMSEGASITARGDILAIGNSLNPIIFTSIKDDSVGGDTNQDASETEPAMGDWKNFLIRGEGTRVTMDYVEIHYAGGGTSINGLKRTTSFISVSSYGEPQIELKEINITHSSITNNFGTVGFYGEAIFNISESNFYNDADCPLPDPEGWDPRFLRCDRLSLSKGGSIAIEAPYVYWGHEEGPTTLEDYIGGVKKGTRAYFNVNHEPFLIEPWPSDLTGPVETGIDPVIIVPGIMGSWYDDENGWELDPILGVYDNLYKALVENGGYIPEETLFKFPYEWRQDNALSAFQLKQKIGEVKEICDCDKVDIVAHSMGGLVTRHYIESNNYENDIDQLVFLGTPHRGSPKSYLKWDGASGFIGPKEWLMKQYFNYEAHARGYEILFDYIQDYVISIKQLLPTYAYLQDIGEIGLREYDKINYPNNYPYNIFLENLNSEENLNKLADSGVNIFNIIGDTGDNTIGVIRLSSGEDYWPVWKHGYAEELVKLAGDNTVPDISSSLFTPTKINGADHLSLPSKAQKQIIEYLTSTIPAFDIIYTPELEEVLIVGVYSPVDFVIISPSGKKLGKDFINKSDINEIENAFYAGFQSETEFAVIVNPGQGNYRVELEGVDEGTYGLGINIIINNESAETQEELIFGIISAGDEEIFEFSYQDNNGTPEIIVQKEINIEELEKDLVELFEAGEMKEKQTYNYLSAKFRKLKDIYGKIDNKGQEQEEKRIDEFIKESDKIVEKLEFYLNKGWITQTAFNILINNINYLIENL